MCMKSADSAVNADHVLRARESSARLESARKLPLLGSFRKFQGSFRKCPRGFRDISRPWLAAAGTGALPAAGPKLPDFKQRGQGGA